jgi:hypothetical protein
MPRQPKNDVDKPSVQPEDPLQDFEFVTVERNRFPDRQEHTITINKAGVVSLSGDLGHLLIPSDSGRGWVQVGYSPTSGQIAIRASANAEGCVRITKPKGSRYIFNARQAFEIIQRKYHVQIIPPQRVTLEGKWLERGDSGAVTFIAPLVTTVVTATTTTE